VEGELLALDVLLDRDLGHVARALEDLRELLLVARRVRVGRAGARDRLDDQREADALARGARLDHPARARVPRRAHAGAVAPFLPRLAVAEAHGRLDAHARDVQGLAQARGQHDARLPQALDAIDATPVQPAAHGIDDRGLVPQALHLQVVRERAARLTG